MKLPATAQPARIETSRRATEDKLPRAQAGRALAHDLAQHTADPDVDTPHHADQLARQLETHLSHTPPHDLSRIPGILQDEAAITASGFVPWHVDILCLVAQDQNAFLLFRPLNPDCTGLLQEGCIAKPPSLKAKSADWGPMQGYIPFDPRLSKTRQRADHNPNDALIHQHPDRFSAQPLALSIERLGHLCDKGVIKGKAGEIFTCENLKFKLAPGEAGKIRVLHQAPGDADFAPVLIMCDQHGQPFTADYDTFAVYPAIGNYREHYLHEVPAPRERWRAALTAIRHGLGQPQRSQHALTTDRESDAHKKARLAINALVREGGGSGQIITHGPEQENIAHFEQDPRILVITPEGQAFCTTDWQQTQAVAHAAHNQGYLTYDNPAYNKAPGESFRYLGRAARIPDHKTPPEWHPKQAWDALVGQREE